VPAGVPLINDDHLRVYAGEDPSTVHFTQSPTVTTAPLLDRIEVVHFPRKGLHLVICGVLPHFLDNMWGWVRVVGNDE
jgi:hypothetical protein